jgi:hypothetical protein
MRHAIGKYRLLRRQIDQRRLGYDLSAHVVFPPRPAVIAISREHIESANNLSCQVCEIRSNTCNAGLILRVDRHGNTYVKRGFARECVGAAA